MGKLRDAVELEALELTGDPETAEQLGDAVVAALEHLAELLGVDLAAVDRALTE